MKDLPYVHETPRGTGKNETARHHSLLSPVVTDGVFRITTVDPPLV